MRPLAAAVALALILIPALDDPPVTLDRSLAPTTSPASVIAADRARITRHLERVERHLASVETGHLTPAQRRARAAAIGYLREYRERGAYPHNHDFAGRTPYFVDEHGVPCAMAYVLARSGARELVARVAATSNNAYVRDLASDPELVAWLERNGMTAAEAALVQPTYGSIPPPEPEPTFMDEVRGQYGLVGVATILADAYGASLVMRRPDELSVLRGAIPLIAGTAGATFALSVLNHGDDDVTLEALALANFVAGVATAAVGLRHLFAAPPAGPPHAGTVGEARVRFGPALVPGAGFRPGLAIHAHF